MMVVTPSEYKKLVKDHDAAKAALLALQKKAEEGGYLGLNFRNVEAEYTRASKALAAAQMKMTEKDSKMSDETERAKEIDEAVKAADAKRRADAEEAAMAGEKLDKIIAHLDSLGKRMDAFEAARSKDEEGDGEMEGEIEKGKPRELGADSVRKDSAETLEEIENHKLKIGPTYKVAADSVLAEIQSEAQRASDAWAKQTVHPWEGESVTAYRRRTAKEHQQHSPAWKDVDLHTLSGQALRNATAQIYADSIAASESPASYPETLVERVRHDPVSGQKRIEFYGSPSAWTNQFKSGAMRVTAFKTGSGWRQE
jgi:hypothetical protein